MKQIENLRQISVFVFALFFQFILICLFKGQPDLSQSLFGFIFFATPGLFILNSWVCKNVRKKMLTDTSASD
jgi:hypothetical protein